MAVGSGYSNLEYDLEAGRRGSRQDHVAGLVRRLTGAGGGPRRQQQRRGRPPRRRRPRRRPRGRRLARRAVEIGDGFRIPDVLARSGARLVEVGTTNRTRAGDYERAIRSETALLPSRPPVELPHRRLHGAAFSGGASSRSGDATTCRSSTTWARGRSWISATSRGRRRASAGVDLVCFSGDKLLGGPQAGIVAGRADLVERLRRHPLQRALRADKLTLAALEGTLAAVASEPDSIPVLRMLREPAETVRARAERLAASWAARSSRPSRAPAGARCRCELEAGACAVEEPLAGRLRLGEPPVVAIVRDGRTLLDCRTLAEAEEVAAAVAAARERRGRSRRNAADRRHRGPHRPRQDVARSGADRQGHRPPARGAGARGSRSSSATPRSISRTAAWPSR